ncbi:MAG: Rnase Y domain-containing protein, partial [Actinomycetota bacterium]|nr:Rnase Y domain-containing protein [Actinomycetota bacterium]
MVILVAAALIAVAIVVAAITYARVRAVRLIAGRPPAQSSPTADLELSQREAELAQREAELARREAELTRRDADLERERSKLVDAHEGLHRELERVSGLSAASAKQMLVTEVEEQARHDAARKVRQIEEETKRDADRRVRNILAVCMQRLAAGHATETTVSVVQLSADDM